MRSTHSIYVYDHVVESDKVLRGEVPVSLCSTCTSGRTQIYTTTTTVSYTHVPDHLLHLRHFPHDITGQIIMRNINWHYFKTPYSNIVGYMKNHKNTISETKQPCSSSKVHKTDPKQKQSPWILPKTSDKTRSPKMETYYWIVTLPHLLFDCVSQSDNPPLGWDGIGTGWDDGGVTRTIYIYM